MGREVPCVWCWVKTLGSWLQRTFLSIQLPADPFPSIDSHFHVPRNCHASHPSFVGTAKWVGQQPHWPQT